MRRIRRLLGGICSRLFCRFGYHRWQSDIEGYRCVWCGLTASWDEIFAYLDEDDNYGHTQYEY